ncbi:PelD GGDEF domain-containing protein [Acidihalobacter prosperus]|uniref:PelD GGDEF domain-containing protein n=1 Tax=Acidihalobacter prosperus TaxID=160660 RepID=A0A1A6C1R5_9GAMM|nr:PelD GGDEF domain-containing protein [Acidihalobacter prosperus]OBS08494.1 hypothetical protein Thpro_022744 [Acidihalobacter prosperus]
MNLRRRHTARLGRLGPGPIAEILLLPLAALWLGHLLSPNAPFDIGGFPWLWLAPLLIGLRYGIGPALAASGILAVGGLWLPELGLGNQAMALPQIVGGMLVSLIGGQYATLWHGRLGQAEARLYYSENRLESLTRAFYVTRISHDRLEETLITRPVSLRGALEAVRTELQHNGSHLTPEAGQALLQLLAHYCRIESASLYAFEGGQLSAPPLARIGQDGAFNADDPLVVLALEREEAAYFSVDQIVDGLAGEYRLVIPIITADGSRIGLLVVSDMPLLALDEENLLTATAILEYFADEAAAQRDAGGLLKRHPRCPATFAHELYKICHLRARVGAQSTLVLFRPKAAQPNTELLLLILSMRRGLDQYWQHPLAEDAPSLLALLPLSGSAGAHGFVARVDALSQDQFGLSLSDAGWVAEVHPIETIDPDTVLQAVLGQDPTA